MLLAYYLIPRLHFERMEKVDTGKFGGHLSQNLGETKKTHAHVTFFVCQFSPFFFWWKITHISINWTKLQTYCKEYFEGGGWGSKFQILLKIVKSLWIDIKWQFSKSPIMYAPKMILHTNFQLLKCCRNTFWTFRVKMGHFFRNGDFLFFMTPMSPAIKCQPFVIEMSSSPFWKHIWIIVMRNVYGGIVILLLFVLLSAN